MGKKKRRGRVPGKAGTAPAVRVGTVTQENDRLWKAVGVLHEQIGVRNVVLQELDDHLTDRHRRLLAGQKEG